MPQYVSVWRRNWPDTAFTYQLFTTGEHLAYRKAHGVFSRFSCLQNRRECRRNMPTTLRCVSFTFSANRAKILLENDLHGFAFQSRPKNTSFKHENHCKQVLFAQQTRLRCTTSKPTLPTKQALLATDCACKTTKSATFLPFQCAGMPRKILFHGFTMSKLFTGGRAHAHRETNAYG